MDHTGGRLRRSHGVALLSFATVVVLALGWGAVVVSSERVVEGAAVAAISPTEVLSPVVITVKFTSPMRVTEVLIPSGSIVRGVRIIGKP